MHKQQLSKPSTWLFAALLSSTLTACDSGSSTTAAQPEAYQGVWERSGYGEIYWVSDNGGRVYEHTRSTCVLSEYADNTDLADFFADSALSSDQQSITLGPQTSGSFAITLNKISALPSQCEAQALNQQVTPSSVFEHFAQSYSDYYAFFTERGIDWQARVADARVSLHDGLSDAALFDLLSNMISPLDDGHVQLQGNGTTYRPAQLKGANVIVEEAFSQQSEFDDLQLYANNLSQQYWQIIADMLDEGSVRTFDGAIPDRLIWGTINNGQIGYLYIASMAYLSPSEDGLDQWANSEVMNTVMQDVMRDLGNTQGMIIDLRKNSGGHDTVSQVVASYFTDQPRGYGSKQARSYLGDTPIVESFVMPRGETPYLNPVALIAGVET
ncbi:MAG: S41 family peptidase, partial [Granulosicoccaceae bacterium]